MEGPPIFILLLPFVVVVMVGLLGRTRRVGFWGAFILAIVLTPIGGLLVTVISGPKPIGRPKPRPKASKAPLATQLQNRLRRLIPSYGSIREPKK